MTKDDFLILLNESISRYIKKSESFNSKRTLLFCKSEELKKIQQEAKIIGINFDYVCVDASLKNIIETYGFDVNYFISELSISKDIYISMLNNGVPEDQIYVGFTKKDYFDLYVKRDNVYKNIKKVAKVYSFLKDDKSKRTYLNIITRLCVPYQFHYYYEFEDFPQYYPGFFSFTDKEVYLDAGVCDGINILQFIEAVSRKYKLIYGFEADSYNYRLSLKNLKNFKKIILYNAALYSNNNKLSFFSSVKTGKRGNAHVQPDGDMCVNGFRGDDLRPWPTYIKMDIEGSEKEALMGLSNCIKKSLPQMAICIYHFQEDFWEVPLLIRKLNPEYSICIRNHERMRTLLESVCYAFSEKGE